MNRIDPISLWDPNTSFSERTWIKDDKGVATCCHLRSGWDACDRTCRRGQQQRHPNKARDPKTALFKFIEEVAGLKTGGARM